MSLFERFFGRKTQGLTLDPLAAFDAEGKLFLDGVYGPCGRSTEHLKPFFPQENTNMTYVAVYFEFMCFFLHMINRLATETCSYEQVDRLYKDLASTVIKAVVEDAPNDRQNELRSYLENLLNTREVEYGQSTEYANKRPKAITGTSIVDKLTRNVSELLNKPYNPEIHFQIHMAARPEVLRLPELIENYRKTHFPSV